MKKLLIGLGTSIAAIAALVIAPLTHAAAWSTSTVGTAMDDVSGITWDYFQVMLQKFWPFLLGALAILSVIALGLYLIRKFFHHK